MTFLQPWWFLAAPLALVIVALHIRQRTTHRIGSTSLWHRIADTSSSRFAWRRPPITVPLILQLLAFLLVVVALARPIVATGGAIGAEHLIIVLDTSGSMAARVDASDDRSRLDAAKAYARTLVSDPVTSGVQLTTLLTAGTTVDAEVVRSADRADVARALEVLAGPGGASPWDNAARRALALALPHETVRVIVLTDGPASTGARAAFDRNRLGRDLDVVEFGGALDNTALLDVRVEQLDAEQGASTRVSGTIARHLTDAAPVPVTVWFTPEGTATALPWHEMETDGEGTSLPFSIELDLPGAGLLEVRLADDGLPADDTWASTVFAMPRVADVLIVGRGNPALERAVASIEHVNVVRTDDLPSDSATYDVVIVDRAPIDAHPGTNTLWIARSPVDAAPETAGGPSTASEWDASHPVSEGVDWNVLEDVSAQPTTLPAGATHVVRSGDMALVWARTTAAGREVGVAFEPAAHAWHDTLGFPVFVDNFVRWAVPELGLMAPPPCYVGRVCQLPPSSMSQGAVVERLGDTMGPWQIPSPFVGTVHEASPEDRWMPHEIESGFVPDRPGSYRVGPNVIPVSAAAAEANLLVGAARAGLHSGIATRPGRAFDLGRIFAAVAAALLVLEALIAWRSDPRVTTSRTRMLRLLALRTAVVAFVGLALFHVPLPAIERMERSIVLLDDPALLTGDARQRALAAVGETEASSETTSGRALRLIGAGVPGLDGSPDPNLDRGATPDLAASLDSAAGWLGPTSGGRIILATNAEAGAGDLTRVWHELFHQDTIIEYLPVSFDGSNDVSVASVRAPQRIAPGVPFTLHSTIVATSAQTVDVTMVRDGEPVEMRTLAIEPGDTEVAFERTGEPAGTHVYEVAISAAGGHTGNDRQGAVVTIGGSARIGLVTQRAEAATLLRDVLANAGLAVEIMAPDDLPYRLPQLLPYDVLMLLDVPAVALHSVQQEAVEAWVRTHGGGLVIAGGRNTFGPGGYYQTPLEQASPLSSRIPGEAPEVALLFILDRSGSMTQQVDGVSRLAIAKEATTEAASLLDDESSVGIVVFDELARVLFPLQSVDNLEGLEMALAPLDPAGGTSIYPALAEAVGQFAGVDASAKHIVLMSDGLSEPGDFRGIVDTLREMDVTVSTVAIGQGADTQVLSSIATWGGGAFHATTDFRALPSILAQETLLLSGTPIEEGTVPPTWIDRGADFLEGMPDTLPPLEGFVRTSAKPEGVIHLATPDDAPLLASWRHGLGRVVAFTSDATGPWIEPWLASEAYSLLWPQAARWVVPPIAKPGIHVEAVQDANTIRVAATAVSEDGTPASGLALLAEFGGDVGAVEPRMLEERSVGLYVAELPARAAGAHSVVVRPLDEGATFEDVRATTYVSYPSTLRIGSATSAAARGLAMLSGGRTLLGGEAPPPGSVRRQWRWTPAWTPWLAIALGLFLLELVLRYGRGWLRRLGSNMRGATVRASSPAYEQGAASPR